MNFLTIALTDVLDELTSKKFFRTWNSKKYLERSSFLIRKFLTSSDTSSPLSDLRSVALLITREFTKKEAGFLQYCSGIPLVETLSNAR